jgi:hypothetical protein
MRLSSTTHVAVTHTRWQTAQEALAPGLRVRDTDKMQVVDVTMDQVIEPEPKQPHTHAKAMAALLTMVGGIVVGHGAVTFPVRRFALVRFQDLLCFYPACVCWCCGRWQ